MEIMRISVVRFGFLFCVLAALASCPELEAPYRASLRGMVIFDDPPDGYAITRVHIYSKAQEYLGVAAVDSDNRWNMSVACEDGTEAFFWVELSYNYDVYFNAGYNDAVNDGMYYELHVQPNPEDNDFAWRPILSAADLARMGQDRSRPMDGKYILIHDIEINAPWEPIGEATGDFFSGTLNGRKGTIRVNSVPGGTREYSGIFSRIKDGIIENLTLEVNNIEVSLYAQANQNFGVLAGSLEGSSQVNHVALTGSRMTVSRSGMSEAYIGGIAGVIKDQVEIKNSSSQTEIIVDIKTPALMTYTGGITGYLDNEAVVRQSINSSSIKVSSETGSAATGGIAGGIAVTAQHNNPQILNSYSTGNISCSAGVRAIASGIVAAGNGFINIAFCYTSGNVLAITQSGDIYCAGIVGYPREKDSGRPAAAQNKINSCAVFAQTIAGSADENPAATHSVNRITETECTECAITGSAAGACPRPSVVGVSAMCGCVDQPSSLLPSREDFMLPGNVVEAKTNLLFNGRPISAPGETCHCGRPVGEIQQSQLQNWDFAKIWFWPIGTKFPALLQRDDT